MTDKFEIARRVEESLSEAVMNGVLHEDIANDYWKTYLTEVVGLTADEWAEVA